MKYFELENYEVTSNGIVKQIKKQKYPYSEEYNNEYNKHGILNDQISFLRLGFIIGSIKRIPKNILDIGYGNGAFLKACNTIISKSYGFDVTNYPVPEKSEKIFNIYENHFDVVSLFDCLEHWENIYELKKIKCNYVIISVPNLKAKSAEEFLNWKHYKPNEHLWYFNEESLIAFFNEIGFDLIEITNLEDAIRKSSDDEPNILTACFKKI